MQCGSYRNDICDSVVVSMNNKEVQWEYCETTAAGLLAPVWTESIRCNVMWCDSLTLS